MIYLKLMFAFLSTAGISFLLFYALLKQQKSDSHAIIEGKDKAAMKQFKQELKSERWSWQKLVMSKWVAFGGGFYGVMAVLTYVVVEFWEVVEFLTSEASLMATLSAMEVSDVVGFFVNSLMNFITAITWPVYWMNRIEGHATWVWFMVVYFGYASGQFFAKNMNNPYSQSKPES